MEISFRLLKQETIMEKLLTICTAAYNAERTIGKMLDSVLECNHRELLEIIVVNDGSTDGTEKIVSNYVNSYPEIVALLNQDNAGSGAARNVAFENAHGGYLKIIDADDEVLSEQFDKYIELLMKVDADLVWNGYIIQNAKTGKRRAYDFCVGYLKPMKTYDLEKDINIKMPVELKMHGTTYKTDIIRNNNIRLSTRMSYVDSEFILYPLPFVKTFCYIDQPFYIYNIGLDGQSVSPAKRISNEKKIDLLIDRTFEYKKNHNRNKILMTTVMSNIYFLKYNVHLAKSDFSEKNKLVDFDRQIKEKDSDTWEFMGKKFKYVRLFRLFNYNGYYLMIIAGFIKNRIVG